MPSEKFVNNASSVLNGGIDDTQNTLDVLSASSFPATGVFRIRVEDEIMIVESVNVNEFTVARGAEGTAAATHSDASLVTGIVTAASLKKLVDRGAQFTDRVLADFDDTNLSTLAVNPTDGVLKIDAPARTVGDGFELGHIYRPFNIAVQALCRMFVAPCDDAMVNIGIGVKDTIGGKIIVFGLSRDPGEDFVKLRVSHYSSFTDDSPVHVAECPVYYGDKIVLSILADSGNLIFQMGPEAYNGADVDSSNWSSLWLEAETSFLDNSPDQWLLTAIHYGDQPVGFGYANLQVFTIVEA